MKQKYTQYGLILLASAVWAFVGYRVYQWLQPNDESSQIKIKPLQSVQQFNNSFSLLLDYPTPFKIQKGPTQKTIVADYSQNNIQDIGYSDSSIIVEPDSLLISDWPEIQYLGFADRVKGSQNKTALISINGETEMMDQNETIDGIRLNRLTQDSIQINYNGESKTYYNN